MIDVSFSKIIYTVLTRIKSVIIGDFMKLRNNIIFIKILLLFFVFICSNFFAYSAENSLSEISVKKTYSGQYNILLKLNKSANVKKSFDGENLILTIPSTLPSDSIDIIYDNASGLHNVTVQKKNTNNTLILLQGDNISNSQIFTKDISTGFTKKIDDSNPFFTNILFVSDKKFVVLFSLLALFFFTIILASKPRTKTSVQQQHFSSSNSYHNKSMTLRRKNLLQSKNIPSISYKLNGSFSSVSVSKPSDFDFNNNQLDEQIRKVG